MFVHRNSVTTMQYERGHCVPPYGISNTLYGYMSHARRRNIVVPSMRNYYIHGPATVVAPHHTFSPPLFLISSQLNAPRPVDKTCRYGLLLLLVQMIVSTKIRLFDYVICEDQKCVSRGFIHYRHLKQRQATRAVRQF
jgi:hypothetical protein